MPFCPNCGTSHDENSTFCPSCGTRVNGQAAPQAAPQPASRPAPQPAPRKESGAVDQIKNTADHTDKFDPEDIKTNNLLALLSYLGILLLIPLLMVKNSKFCRFHANQGLLVAILCVVVYVMEMIICALCFIHWVFIILLLPVLVLGLACTALAVLGIINAIRGKAKELPLIGKIKILRW